VKTKLAALTTALLCAIAVCFIIFGSGSAQARGFMFGTDETITKIVDVKALGPNGERLFLGYKLSRFAILAPVYMTDDGYVLGVATDPKRFFTLNAIQLSELQKSGLLPNPLPPYKIEWFEWAFGYLLWLLLPLIGLWIYIEDRWKARRQAQKDTAVGSAPIPVIATAPLEFFYSKAKLWGYVALGAAIAVAGGVVAATDNHPVANYERLNWQVGGAMFAALGIGLCALIMRKIFGHSGPVLTLTPTGFSDTRLSKHQISWMEVEDLKALKVGSTKYLELALAPGVKERIGAPKGIGFKGANKLMVAPNGLAVKFNDLVETFQTYLLAAHAAQSVDAHASDEKMFSAYVVLGSEEFCSDATFHAAIRQRFPSLPPFDPPQQASQDAPVFVNTLDGQFCTVMCVGAPNPMNANESFIRHAYWWPDASTALQNRKAHVIVYVKGDANVPAAVALKTLAKLTAAVASVMPAPMAIIWDGADALWPTRMFVETVEGAGDHLPLDVLVSVKQGVDPDYEGQSGVPTRWLRTDGLASLGHKEIEARGVEGDPAEAAAFMLGMAYLLAVAGRTIKEGESISVAGHAKAFSVRETTSSLIAGRHVYALDMRQQDPMFSVRPQR
jgi:hypothetical protein